MYRNKLNSFMKKVFLVLIGFLPFVLFAQNGSGNFPTSVTLGSYKTNDSLREEILNRGYDISDEADVLLGKINPFTTTIPLPLYVVTLEQLGFASNIQPTYETIIKKAQSLGYKLVPAEVGPLLRISYHDFLGGNDNNWSASDWLYVASQPITDASGHEDIFMIKHGGTGRSLDVAPAGNKDYFANYFGTFNFVFTR